MFGADFLDDWELHFNYDNILVCWMEYDIPLCDTAYFFLIVAIPHYSCQLILTLKMTAVAISTSTLLQHAKYEQTHIHNVEFDQHHLSLD